MSKFACIVACCALSVLVTACGGSSSSSQPAAAATVNGHEISMATFNKQVDFKRHVDTYAGVDVCQVKSMGSLCQQLKKTVLNTLINNEIIHQYARAHGITISQADFQRRWTQVFDTRFHGDRYVLKDYASGLHLSVQDVKNSVYDDMLQTRVMYQVTQNMPLTGPATLISRIAAGDAHQLQQVTKALHRGYNFNFLALELTRQKNSVCSQMRCGLLGWYPNALLPAPERQVASARVGKVVGPFPTQQAWILIWVMGHTSKYPFTAAQVYSLRQQQFTSWLNAEVHRANVRRYATT